MFIEPEGEEEGPDFLGMFNVVAGQDPVTPENIAAMAKFVREVGDKLRRDRAAVRDEWLQVVCLNAAYTGHSRSDFERVWAAAEEEAGPAYVN